MHISLSLRTGIMLAGLAALIYVGIVVAGITPAVAGSGDRERTAPVPPAPATVPAACALAWRQVAAPVGATPIAVTVPGPGNAWAAGGSTIMRWNGSAWATQAYPTPTPMPSYTSATDRFAAVSSRANGEVWVAGMTLQDPASFGDQPAALLYWNGTTWTRIPGLLAPQAPREPQGGYFNYYNLHGVAAVAPGEAWVVGQNTRDTGNKPIVWHFCRNGGPCPQITPTLTYTASTNFTAAAATGPNDVWVVGNDGLSGLIEHWNGTTWTQMAHDPIGTIQAVAAQVPDEAWAAGSGGILHFDGTTWNSVSALAENYTGIAIQGQSSVWAVSATGIVYGDQFSFGPVSSPSGAVGIAVDLATGGDLWAVGPNLLHYPDVPLFTDVGMASNFYPYVQRLACRNLIGGYTASPPCTTGAPCFLPGNNVTRGQTAKFISNAAGYIDAIPSAQQTFTDVPFANPFWLYVERSALHMVVGGYSGSPPCTTGSPCFLPGNRVSRGQTAKFVSNAAGYTDVIPATRQTFTDVPYASPFWLYIERGVVHGVVSGYTASPPCTTGTPCFLPNNAVTRGQISKFIANAFVPVGPDR